MTLAAIVVAAGRGSRMGGDVPKALRPLCGLPVFAYSLRTICKLPDVGNVILVVSDEQKAMSAQLLRQHDQCWSLPIDLVTGGAERQDSVANGLAAINAAADLVMVHDAARPFASLASMQACVAAAADCGAAIVATPALDTIKLCEGPMINATLDRRRVWMAQTPQVFRTDWLREAYDRARLDGVTATDDAALVERCGHGVRVVEGEASNRKLTTPDDWRWAEWFLGQPERGSQP